LSSFATSISFFSIHQVPQQAQAIPDVFCWTRFGTEAGETIEEILERKEQERLDNDGVFFWGIGNSVAPGMAALLECSDRPEVLFSPIRGKPRAIDRVPAARFAWTAGHDLNGQRFELPPTARVTSGGPAGGSGRPHYALVCTASSPLSIDSGDAELDFLALRNLVSGNPLGVSQVTAMVRSIKGQSLSDMRYRVAMRAELAPPYFVRLTEVFAEPPSLASAS
jgi:hypothetical protein